MVMLTKVGAVTARAEEPLAFPNVAVIMVLPILRPVAIPKSPTVAAVVLSELQVAVVVRSLVLWSEYVPVAVNCSF